MLLSLGALAVTAGVAGCGSSAVLSPAGARGIKNLAAGVRYGKAQFPLWPTTTKLSSHRRHASTYVVGIAGYSGNGTNTDPPGPSGSMPTAAVGNGMGWHAYGYRFDNATSLYDDGDSCVMQSTFTLNSDNTITVQCVGATDDSVWYTLPSFDSMPIDSWCSLLGSSYYMDSTTHTATMNAIDGETYLYSRDSSNNLVIHANNDAYQPDITVASRFLVGALPSKTIHTAGVACNAASFGLGFFGAAAVLSGVTAVIASGGTRLGTVASGVTTVVGAMYAGAKAVCANGKLW